MSRGHYGLVLAPWVVLAIYVGLAVWTTPDARGYGTHEQLGLGACVFRDWLGAPCPTCGVTTSASHLVHGGLRAAWMTQPLGVLLGAAAAAGVPITMLCHQRRLDLGQWWLRHGAKIWSALAVVVTACWLF